MVAYESLFSQMTNSDLTKNSFIYGFPRWSLSTAPGARFSKAPVTFRARNQIFKSKYKE